LTAGRHHPVVNSPSGIDASLVIIFVTGGENGQPNAARDRLAHEVGY
jgi:hypothetical protein